MSTTTSPGTPAGAGRRTFVTTHWSMVLRAGNPEEVSAQDALSRLCEAYWFPLYGYVRRRGYNPEDAQDLTQEFFARLLAHNWLADADCRRGRFRTFLLTALNRFLSNEWDRAHAQKRDGTAVVVSFDTVVAEGRFQADPGAGTTPDHHYDRQWAMTLLEKALARLAAECRQAGKTTEFEILSQHLTAERGSIPYGEVADALGVSAAAARQAAHRLRKRFREVFRDEISQTVESPAEADEEIRHLLGALSL